MSRTRDAETSDLAEEGLTMPPDWAPHARTWMCWPCRAETWGSDEVMLNAKQATARIARAISTFEPVVLVARHEDVPAAKLATAGKVQLFATPLDDSWVRDTGPTFLSGPDGRRAAVQWQFNAWGGKYKPYANDAELATRIAEHSGIKAFEAPLICEGGAIHTDGEGTLITTEQCLLNPNRNPHLGKEEVEVLLSRYAGIRKVIWLGSGFCDDETDGHIDNIACFAGPGKVIVGVPSSPSLPDAGPVKEAIRRLKAARDAMGRPLDVIELPQPRRVRFDWRGRIMQTSYVNFYLANGGLVMPSFNDPNDDKAEAVLAACFPGRDVLQVEVLDLLQGGGGIHCISLGEPTA
jgi:agmatine deiminase